jgi:hypothetical protein
MKNILFMLVGGLLLFASCSKDDSDTEQTKDYVQLKTGNYWVYRLSNVDTLGVETITDSYDSVYVSGDTTINGNVFTKKYHTWSPYSYTPDCLRDSSNYLVSPNGRKMFSPVNFSDTLIKSYNVISYTDTTTLDDDTLFFYFYKMSDKGMSLTVPAGTFITMDFKGTYIPYGSYANTLKTIYCHNYYAKNIGLIQYSSTFANSRTQMVWKLVRYKVN